MPFDRKGPLPLPNCFLCYTRPSSRSGLRPTRPPWLILLPRNISCFTFTPSQVSYSWKKSYLKLSHSLCPLRAQWWSRFFSSHWTSSPNSSHKTLLWFYLKFAVSSCDSDFFHVTGVPTTGPHEIPIQILSQFWKYWFDFLCRFSQNKLIISFELKKTEKPLKIARHYCDCRLYLFSLLEVNDAP